LEVEMQTHQVRRLLGLLATLSAEQRAQVQRLLAAGVMREQPR
jgi:hypothetical protein